MVGIEIPTHINKLEATFNLAGWDPTIMRLYRPEQDRYHQIFTAYGLIRDRRIVGGAASACHDGGAARSCEPDRLLEGQPDGARVLDQEHRAPTELYDAA